MYIFFISIIFILHIFIIVYFLGHLITSLFAETRIKKNFKIKHTIIEALLILLLFACFYNYESSNFEYNGYAVGLIITTFFGLICYWLVKLKSNSASIFRFIPELGVSIIFWLSIFSTIKLFPYLLLFWIPFYGLLAITPLLFAILTYSEIRYLSSIRGFNPFYFTFSGLLPFIIIQLVMNLYTATQWELLNFFYPSTPNFSY